MPRYAVQPHVYHLEGARVTGAQTQATESSQRALLPYDVVDRRIRQMEREHDLLQYVVDGWCVWPLLRFGVQYALAYDLQSLGSHVPWSQRLWMALHDLPRLLMVPRARYVVKTYTSGLAEREGHLYKDIWFDDLISSLGACLKIETINSPAFLPRRPHAYIKSHCTSNGLHLVAGGLAMLGGPRHISEIAQRLSACLKKEFAQELYTFRWIELRLRYFSWLKKLYAGLLQRIRPTYLLTADSGEHALVAAAKELGVMVVELQHGCIDRYHSGYSWTEYALPYKSRMPIPDQYFLYGEHWKQELDANGFWGESLCVVGSLRLDRCRERAPATPSTNACHLLLTTQGLDVEAMIAFITDFLAMAQGQLNVSLSIKLHPVYEGSKALYLDAFRHDPRVQVLLGSESPSTLELLAQAHCHLSISSTCHYDALGMGVPTVILPLASHEIVLPLWQAGHAALARHPHDLLDIVLRYQAQRVPEAIGAHYFAQGALERMKHALT